MPEYLSQGSLVRGSHPVTGEFTVMCQICFEMRTKVDLAVSDVANGYPSEWWDICTVTTGEPPYFLSCAVQAGLVLGRDGVWR